MSKPRKSKRIISLFGFILFLLFITISDIAVSVFSETIQFPLRTFFGEQNYLIAVVIIFIIVGAITYYYEKQKGNNQVYEGNLNIKSDTLAANRQALVHDMQLRYQERLKQISKTIPLTFAERPNAVNPPGADLRPYDLLLRRQNLQDKILPKNTRLIDLFDQSNAQLLILGTPGAGKTFLLYDLAYELVERATTDDKLPVPVIFSLASWQSNQSLQTWMISNLSRRYNSKPKRIEELFSSNVILPLLDGLDEIEPFERRQKCVEAINIYRGSQDHLTPPIVVTCREQEYQNLPELSLNTALVVQPLTAAQINRYLNGSSFASLRQALNRDASLADLARTPLFLSFMASAYRNHVPHISNQVDNSIIRNIVMNDYIIYCCEELNVSNSLRISVNKLRAFLAWLAYGMIVHNNQQDFYVESFQFTWLPLKIWYYLWCFLIVCVYGLAFGLVMGLFMGWLESIVSGLIWGVIFLIFGVLTGVFSSKNISIDGINSWSWKICDFNLDIVVFILFLPLLIGFVTIKAFGMTIGLIGSSILMLVIIIGLGFRTIDGFNSQTPNQGIISSFSTAIYGLLQTGSIGLIFGGAVFTVVEDAEFGVFAGLLGGILGGFFSLFAYQSGANIIKHYTLRLILFFSTPAPLFLVPWLEEACKRGLLMRIGGAYRFRHELLQRHFAEYQEPSFPPVSFLAETENNL